LDYRSLYERLGRELVMRSAVVRIPEQFAWRVIKRRWVKNGTSIESSKMGRGSEDKEQSRRDTMSIGAEALTQP
jgi:hypothetical protein